jgi:CRP-like cAMP-binding protein
MNEKKLEFRETVIVALYERARRSKSRFIRADLKKKAEEIIERHQLTDEEISRIYEEFVKVE